MIVMKFGGTSLADAERIVGAARIVAAERERAPVVVVSALAGITDLLERTVSAARQGQREQVEPALAELERRHRWAMAGAVDGGEARHDLDLAVDALFDELRQLLRSIRVLGELTPRARDALLAFGETLSARIVTAAFCRQGLPAREVDPREVIATDGRHGEARPDLDATAARCAERLAPRLSAGEVPVVGGFVGSTDAGVTTTLGRGGSDTSAAVLGCALGAEEIQIWTDVDGLMSADPKLVPAARTLERVSYAEAAELALYGARVLHPAAIFPAVQRAIPVRVLNSLRPTASGTWVVDQPRRGGCGLAAVASRRGVCAVRVTGAGAPVGPGWLARVLAELERAGRAPDLVLSSGTGVTLVLAAGDDPVAIVGAADPRVRVEFSSPCALVCVVGRGLARDPGLRDRVLATLGALQPALVAVGPTGSVHAVVDESRLAEGVPQIHRQFFEEAVRR